MNWKKELLHIQKEGVLRDPAYVAWETYIEKPMYDEEPGEGQECWPE